MLSGLRKHNSLECPAGDYAQVCSYHILKHNLIILITENYAVHCLQGYFRREIIRLDYKVQVNSLGFTFFYI